MDLRGQLAVLRTHRLLVIGSVVVAMLAAIVATSASTKIYQSQATLIVGQSLTTANPDLGQIDTSQRLSATYAAIATTRPILDAVISKLGLATTPDELREQIAAVAATSSTLVTITVDQPDPEVAAAIANELAGQLIATSPSVSGGESEVQEFVREELITLQRQIEAAQAEAVILTALDTRTTEQSRRLEVLETRLSSLRAAYATLYAQSVTSAANQLSVIEPAVAVLEPTSPNVLLNVLLALFAGLLIGVGAAFLIDYLDDSVKTTEDAAEITGSPVLGRIPRLRELPRGDPAYSLVTLAYPRSGAAEAFRVLRTNLEFSGVRAPVRMIVVTSAMPREGKTTVAMNLAVAFAQNGRRTLLVDADLRRPGVHEVFRVDQAPGLTDLLRSDAVAPESVMHVTQDANLHVIATGVTPPNPAELLASARMEAILKRLARRSDIVIIDAPPVNVVTDAVLLAKLADGAILVVDSGHTRRKAARAACDALERVGVRILGVTVNRSTEEANRTYGYYEDAKAEGAIDKPQTAGVPARAEESRS